MGLPGAACTSILLQKCVSFFFACRSLRQPAQGMFVPAASRLVTMAALALPRPCLSRFRALRIRLRCVPDGCARLCASFWSDCRCAHVSLCVRRESHCSCQRSRAIVCSYCSTHRALNPYSDRGRSQEHDSYASTVCSVSQLSHRTANAATALLRHTC